MTQRLRSHADVWRNNFGLSDEQVAEQVRRDQIDILVDLAGHTADNRLRVFAIKPAPVQATYLGYPDTTGLTAIDYRITDAYADPSESADSFHTERLQRLAAEFSLLHAGGFSSRGVPAAGIGSRPRDLRVL